MIALGVVCCELSGPDASQHADEIEAFTQQNSLELADRRVHVVPTETELALLLAHRADDAVEVIVVPRAAHLAGWLDAMRHQADVHALVPPSRWRRYEATQQDSARHEQGR